jgi:DNA-binding winged helix-turn-helix (wHTH) protein
LSGSTVGLPLRLRFGDCVLDTDRRELTRAGRAVPLLPKAFQLLQVLAERRPQVVAQHELRRLLWPDTMAGGTRLARLVNEVRAATGDEAREGRVIRTAHRFGYAFCGTVVEEPPPAGRSAGGYALEWGARLVALAPGENVIGRTLDAAISVASHRVSRRHARILVADWQAVLEDLGSKNGTYLGGRRIEGPVILAPGDCIGVGPVRLFFRLAGADETGTA